MLAAAVLQFGFLLFDEDMEDGAKAALTVSMVMLIVLCIVFTGNFLRGAPPAPRRIRLLVPVRTFVCVIAARSTRQGPPGRCERTTVRSPDALA